MGLLLCGTHWVYNVVLLLRMEFLFMPSRASWHCIERVHVIVLLDLWYMGCLLCGTHWVYKVVLLLRMEFLFMSSRASWHYWNTAVFLDSLQIWVLSLTSTCWKNCRWSGWDSFALFTYKGVLLFFLRWGEHPCHIDSEGCVVQDVYWEWDFYLRVDKVCYIVWISAVLLVYFGVFASIKCISIELGQAWCDLCNRVWFLVWLGKVLCDRVWFLSDWEKFSSLGWLSFSLIALSSRLGNSGSIRETAEVGGSCIGHRKELNNLCSFWEENMIGQNHQ